ncbi:E3 ubiquitin-protein ligase TRIM33-like [Takifugu rubripes]|uniref:E3 ubiquitin-protein ligase TRIM33-like n=1 Tax=Takifugu rubripes TaxID=31033 RepID=UPI00114539EE|nr:E3 ubiquitin-protein ligase TRIM33-like [Takifugu rubripes]
MAHLPSRRHGYSPHGQAEPAPWVTKGTAPVIPSETNSYPATKAEEPNLLLEKQQPATALAGLLKRIRIPPEAQRILARSNRPVVSLERLNVQAVLLSSSLQPVVSLVRLPGQTEPQISCEPDQQNSSRQTANTGGLSDPDRVPVLWSEAFRPDGSTSDGSTSDGSTSDGREQPYILLDSGSDDWDPDERAEPEMFYLDPDPEQGMVIQLDPELQMDQDLDVEAEMKYEVEDKREDQRFEEVDLCSGQPEGGPDMEEVNEPQPEENGPEPEDVGEPGPEEWDGPEPEDVGEPGPEEWDGPEPEDVGEPGPEEWDGPEPEDVGEPGPEEWDGPEPEDVGEPGPEEWDGPEPEDVAEPGPEEVDGPEPEDVVEPGPEEVDGPEPEDVAEPGPEEVDGPEPEDVVEPGPEEVDGPEPEDVAEPGPEEVDGPEPEDVAEPGPGEVDGPEPEGLAVGPGPGREQVESEDFCAVCLNGGELLCCDQCPKVYHLSCHLPPLVSFPQGDWMCTLCRPDQGAAGTYDCESSRSLRGVHALYTLSNQEQRRCEKLALQLYSHRLSGPFQQPVSPLARNYYQTIKRPMDLSVIRRKLDKANTLHYFSVDQFLQDVLLMLRNCATFNYPDSEVAQAGRSLEVFFLSRLKEVFPDRRFPTATQETMNRARLRWLRKKKESSRKKKYS